MIALAAELTRASLLNNANAFLTPRVLVAILIRSETRLWAIQSASDAGGGLSKYLVQEHEAAHEPKDSVSRQSKPDRWLVQGDDQGRANSRLPDRKDPFETSRLQKRLLLITLRMKSIAAGSSDMTS